MNNSHIEEQSNQESREKLLSRIRKLFAMSKERESSPHEAEIALRRCESLMQKYGIMESDLETSEFGSCQYANIRKSLPTYLKYLAAAVAKLNDCVVVRGSTGAGNFEFRGYAVDTAVCELTLEYLEEALARCLKSAKSSGEIPAGRSPTHDFRLGFALQISDRVKKMVEEKTELSSSPGTSLVVKKMDMVRANCLKGVRLKSARVRYRDNSSNAAGRAAGDSVSLNQQMGNGSPRPVISSS